MVEDISQDHLDISVDMTEHAENCHLGRVNRGGTEEGNDRGDGPLHTAHYLLAMHARDEYFPSNSCRYIHPRTNRASTGRP